MDRPYTEEQVFALELDAENDAMVALREDMIREDEL